MSTVIASCAACKAPYGESYRCPTCNLKRSEEQRARRLVRSPEQVKRDRAYQRAYAAKRYARLRASGLCVGCATESERAYCQSCREAENRRIEDRAVARAVARAIAAITKK